MLHSTPDGATGLCKMWHITHKLKSGENGHYMRGWPLAEPCHGDSRTWAGTLGLPGVMFAAAPFVGGEVSHRA